MITLIQEMFTAFTTVIGGLADGLKEAFMNILYVDPTAETLVFSDPIKFLMVFGGLSLSMGIFWKLWGLIRGKTHG